MNTIDYSFLVRDLSGQNHFTLGFLFLPTTIECAPKRKKKTEKKGLLAQTVGPQTDSRFSLEELDFNRMIYVSCPGATAPPRSTFAIDPLAY